MKLGRIIGKVVSSQKEANLDGFRMLVVSYLDEEMNDTKKTEVCIDTVNAGEGEVVIVCSLLFGPIDRHNQIFCCG